MAFFGKRAKIARLFCRGTEFRGVFEKRRRKADAYMNFVANKEISKQHAQWWDKGMQIFWNNPSSHKERDLDAVASAQAADIGTKFRERN